MTTTTERQPLTARQQDVLTWIAGYINTHEYPPTLREIQHAYGWKTPNAAKCHLEPLRKKGYVTWVEGCSRTIRVIGGDA
jgi:repressor LexA